MEISRVSADQFSVGKGQTVDLQTLLMTLQMDRAENLEKQLTDQADKMKSINEKLKEANEIMAYARGRKEVAAKSGKCSTMSDEVINYYKSNNIKYDMTGGGDNLHLASEWDINIQNLKGFMDGLNSDSQMEMISLQSLMNKRNQSYEMITQTIQKISGVTDKIIGNIR